MNDFEQSQQIHIGPLDELAKQVAERMGETPENVKNIFNEYRAKKPGATDEEIIGEISKIASPQLVSQEPAPPPPLATIALQATAQQYSPEARANKQQEYDTKLADVNQGERAGRLGARMFGGYQHDVMTDIEQQGNKEREQAKENTLGAFDKETKLAFDQLTSGMEVAQKNQALEKGQFEIGKFKQDLSNKQMNADPNSDTSKYKRMVLKQYAPPEFIAQLGGNIEKITGEQIDMIGGVDKIYEIAIQRAIKELALNAAKEAKAEQLEAKAEENEKDRQNKMNMAQLRADTQRSIGDPGAKATATEEAKASIKNVQEIPTKMNTIQAHIDDIDKMLALVPKINTGKIAGPMGTALKYVPIPGVGSNEEKFDVIAGRMKLTNAQEYMKGQGAISDGERKLVGDFSPVRDRGEEALKSDLLEMKRILTKSKNDFNNKLIDSQRLIKENKGSLGTEINTGVAPAPQAAIEALKARPELKEEFKAKYGYLP